MGAQFSNLVFQVPEPPCYGASFDGLQWVDTPLHDKIPIKHTHWTSKQDKPAFFTILYFPGHAEDMGISNSWLNMLSSTLRSNIITFDYPGYGLHAGKPSEKGCFDTAIAVYNYLTKECAVPPSRIILMGKNIGAAVAIHLYHEKCAGTARKKGAVSDVAAGIVLQTPFTSICGVAKGKVPRSHDLFDSRRKIERINCPTFFVHGLLDEVITTKHSRKLSSKISQQTWKVLELEEFGQMIEYADDFLDDFIKFIQVLGGSDPEFKETHAITTQQTPAMFRSTTQLVTQFLETIGMSQYSDKFIAAGFFDMQHLIWMDEIDLMCLEIEEQSHVQKIFEAIKKLRPAPSESADEDQTLSVTDDTSEKSSSSSSKDSKPVLSLLKRSTDLAFDDTAFLRFFRFLWSIDSSKPLTDGQVKTLGAEYKARLKGLWTSMVPYRSIEERTKIVSKGYNGEIWEGCHNGQPIQIKVMNFKRSNIRSFAQQVVRLLSISHHNVVETLAASIDPEQPICLINRHYPEATYLSKYLKGNAFLSLQDRIDVCLQIAEALLFLHQQEPPIVLGDFNSTNVLIIDPRPKPAKSLAPPSKLAQEPPPPSSSSVVEEKTRLIVKVIIDNAVTETKIPALRSMSPELQTNRTTGKSTSADVYSFGFLMYEIFNNRAVFDMLRSPEVALRCAIEFLRPTYEDMNPSLTPKSVFSLINKCWAVSPAERPPVSTIIQELSSSIPDSPSDLIPHPTDPQRPRIAPEDASSLISLLALPSAQLTVYQNILTEGAPLQTPRSSAPKPTPPEDTEESSHGSIFWPKLSDIKKAMSEKGDDIGKITIETASDAWKPFEAMGPLQKRHVAQLLSTVNQEKFSDLIILSGTGRHKQRLYGHRSIVASRCPSLSERIESFSDSSFSIIELPELQPQALLLVLGFFYSGWIPLQPSIIFSVYEAAHFLHCSEVTNLCLVWCRHNSIPDNVLSFPQGPPLAASMSLSSSAASSSSSYSSSPPTSSLMVPGMGQSQMSTYGVPNLRLSCMLSAPSDDPSVTTSFPYSSKQRIENVMESLRQVENGIKNIESQLNNFNSMRQLNLVSKSKRPKEKSSSSSSRRKRTSSSSSLSVIAPGSSPQITQSNSTSSVVSPHS